MRQYTVTDVNGCKVIEGRLPLSDMGALLDAWKDLADEDDAWIADGMLAHYLGAALVVGPKAACSDWRLRFRATAPNEAPTAEVLKSVQDGQPVQLLTEHVRPLSVYGGADGQAREVKRITIDVYGKTQVEYELAPSYSTVEMDPETPTQAIVGVHEFTYWAHSVLATQSPDLVHLVCKPQEPSKTAEQNATPPMPKADTHE